MSKRQKNKKDRFSRGAKDRKTMRNLGRKPSWVVKSEVPAGVSHIQCCQQSTHPQPGDLHNRQRETRVRGMNEIMNRKDVIFQC